jgi:diguanylate cyclase (GGDEF)-like protein
MTTVDNLNTTALGASPLAVSTSIGDLPFAKENILLVEDSKVFQNEIYHQMSNQGIFEVDVATSLSEAAELITAHRRDPYFIALIDLTLPDSTRGEIADYAIDNGIPAIVFTATFDSKLRHDLLEKGVLDYIIKDNPRCIEQLCETAKRLYHNKNITVILVDDSRSSRSYISQLLSSHKLNVIQSHNGKEVLDLLQKNPKTELVITNYHMPDMNGFELTQEIRRLYSREELAIIGMSADKDPNLLPRFLKGGANDFITIPFINEEFNCRISQHLDYIEKVRALHDAVIRDALTGLYNRRHLLSVGHKLLDNINPEIGALAAAMIDIDFFKNVNDTFGHDAGDAVLVHVAALLKKHFKQAAVLARVGGEEFCVLMTDVRPGKLRVLLERVRQGLARTAVNYNNNNIILTASIGAYSGSADNLNDLICKADKALYEAKRSGRNKIIVIVDQLMSPT